MSLAPDVETMYGSYEFSEDERRKLIEYLEENKSQVSKQIILDDTNFEKTHKLYEELSTDCHDFMEEIGSYVLEWNYSDQDWVDLCNDLIKELKK